MNKLIVMLTLLLTPSIISHDSCLAAGTNNIATLTKENGYYKIAVDLSAPQVTRKEVGRACGKLIKENISDYEMLVDSYFKDFLNDNANYTLMLERVDIIWPKVPDIVKDEIAGLAESICSTNKNILGDGLLSPDELRILNLIPDIFRATSCSAVGVLSEASASGNVMTGRNVDWDDGKTFQLSKIQSIITYHFPDNKSVTNISYLGLVIALTGISTNDDFSGSDKGQTLFYALLDSDIGGKLTLDNKRSYAADLRLYAEQVLTIDDMSRLLDSTAKDYTFGHLVFLASKDSLGVYEDNLTYAPSKLRTVKDNPDLYIPWEIPDTIGAVNCFMLKTSLDNTVGVDKARLSATEKNLQTGDNTLYVGNVKRWASQQRILKENGSKHSFDDLKSLSSYGPGKATDGYIYRPSTQQIIIFEPATCRLAVAFHPVGRDIKDAEKPNFIDIELTK